MDTWEGPNGFRPSLARLDDTGDALDCLKLMVDVCGIRLDVESDDINQETGDSVLEAALAQVPQSDTSAVVGTACPESYSSSPTHSDMNLIAQNAY